MPSETYKSIERIDLDSPFYITELPLGNKVYVIDNYLDSSLHHAVDNFLSQSTSWQKHNEVQGDGGRGGLPNHQLWGASYFRGREVEDGRFIKLECESHKYGSPHLMYWFDRKIRTDFSFEWVRFQYMGTNSQTHGLDGSCHSDCSDDDNYNLSFLYYTNTFWNENWGGDLRFYDRFVPTGARELMDRYEIGRVEFKPNRLLMFDGRLPHGAESPSKDARYIDRKSIVLRGDEVRLLDGNQRYANN